MEILVPIHKSTVKALLRKGETFKGYIAPSKVHMVHIAGGWHIGARVTFKTLAQMEVDVRNFSIFNCNAELGHTVRFWRMK
jgi:hypothetical protein